MSVRLRLVEHYDVKWANTTFRVERQQMRSYWFGGWGDWKRIGTYSDVTQARKMFEAVKAINGADTTDKVLAQWSSDDFRP